MIDVSEEVVGFEEEEERTWDACQEGGDGCKGVFGCALEESAFTFRAWCSEGLRCDGVP
jgi:hypothetical protein